mmetsp:Transcript_15641/g.43215  ORF Transcript_15641/g.43215 Transcript_15641/m.43215 type:complete len:136 (-) Transcript_15641:1001-1408(-)
MVGANRRDVNAALIARFVNAADGIDHNATQVASNVLQGRNIKGCQNVGGCDHDGGSVVNQTSDFDSPHRLTSSHIVQHHCGLALTDDAKRGQKKKRLGKFFFLCVVTRKFHSSSTRQDDGQTLFCRKTKHDARSA